MIKSILLSCPKCGVVINWSGLPAGEKLKGLISGREYVYCPICKTAIFKDNDFIGEIEK